MVSSYSSDEQAHFSGRTHYTFVSDKSKYRGLGLKKRKEKKAVSAAVRVTSCSHDYLTSASYEQSHLTSPGKSTTCPSLSQLSLPGHLGLWALSPVLGCLVEGVLPVATQQTSQKQQNRTRAAAAEAAGRLTGSPLQRRTLT